jgi:hypothetical protein
MSLRSRRNHLARRRRGSHTRIPIRRWRLGVSGCNREDKGTGCCGEESLHLYLLPARIKPGFSRDDAARNRTELQILMSGDSLFNVRDSSIESDDCNRDTSRGSSPSEPRRRVVKTFYDVLARCEDLHIAHR